LIPQKASSLGIQKLNRSQLAYLPLSKKGVLTVLSNVFWQYIRTPLETEIYSPYQKSYKTDK
jgi:hypothetical protein